MTETIFSAKPILKDEWDYDNNSISPDNLKIGNNSNKINWICSKCNNRWKATVYNRIHLNSGCPECAKEQTRIKMILKRYDEAKSLVKLFPSIASEWHPTLNDKLDINLMMPTSNYKVWWKCSTCGTEFQTTVEKRTKRNQGCPVCNKYTQTSFSEQCVYFYVKKHYPNAINSYKSIFNNGMELDIFIPEINIGIEYDGNYWHSKEFNERSIKKFTICQQNGIKLLRIKEVDGKKEICSDDCDYSIYRLNNTNYELERCIIEAFKYFSNVKELDINIDRDKGIIRESYYKISYDKSLQSTFPEIANQWDLTLNERLTPSMVMPGSHLKVWWKCDKCGNSYLGSISHKTSNDPRGCPICANKKIVIGFNDLATKRPDLASEWHHTLNGNLTPNQIAPNYSKKVGWKCNKCENEYLATPNKRISRNQGCPICANNSRAEKHINHN